MRQFRTRLRIKSLRWPAVDWRIDHGDEEPDDLPRPILRQPWTVILEPQGTGFLATLEAPDGTKRYILLEIDRGNPSILAYLDDALTDAPLIRASIGDRSVHIEEMTDRLAYPADADGFAALVTLQRCHQTGTGAPTARLDGLPDAEHHRGARAIH